MTDIFDKVPDWLKSLHQVETELRNAARSGVVLQKDKAIEHLTQARRHIEDMMSKPQNSPPGSSAPTVQPPLRRDGDI